MPVIEYNKGKIEGYKLEIQEILNALNAPHSLLNGNLAVDERALLLAPAHSHPRGTATTPVSEGMLELRFCHLVQNTDRFSFLFPSTATLQLVDV